MMIRAGSIIRYQANVSIPYTYYEWSQSVTPDSIKAALVNAAQSKGAQLTSYAFGGGGSSGSTSYGNIQANFTTKIDRGAITDLQYDLDGGIRSSGAALMGSTVNLTSPGGAVPGTIPALIQNDTSGQGSTVLGTAGQFWFDQIGQQVQGLLKGLTSGGPMMWLGIGVVALILFNRK